MQIRIPFAAVLLGCAAMAQDAPSEPKVLPQPFAPKSREFTWPKRPLPVQPFVAPGGSTPVAPTIIEPAVCSIPLVNVTPAGPTARMPTLPTQPNSAFAMKFAPPPAPPCKDEGASKRT